MLNSVDNAKAKSFLSKSFSQATIPFIILIIGLFATSSTSIFIKLALKELTVEAILFDRLLITTIVFACGSWGLKLWQSQIKKDSNTVISTEKKANQTTPITIGLMILLGITYLTGRFLYTWSLQQTTAVNALTLSNLTPIFTFLGAWLFIGKQFDRRFLLGLMIACGGGIFLTLEDWFHQSNQSFDTTAILGDSAALLSAMIYAVAMLLSEKLLKYLPDLTFLTWRSAISLVLIAPLVWNQPNSILPHTSTGWLAVLGLGLVSGVIAHTLVTYTFKYFSAAFLTIVFLLEPFPVALFAWAFLGEFLSIFNIIGFILISVGIYWAKTGQGADS